MENGSTLVKFGEQKYIERLCSYGEIYMNNLSYFWQVENDENRHDPNDSLISYHMGNKGYAVINGVKINMSYWECRNPPPNPETINIFCMYALRPFHGSFPVDERNFAFGDTALVILNGDEFISRVEDVLKKEYLIEKSDFNLVEYIPDNYNGEIKPFRKRERFKHQSEWRLVCVGGSGGPRKLHIDKGLKDISRIIPATEINSEIRIVDNI